MALQIRRGTLAELATITPELAEPIWTTDTHALYLGDGVTPGGWPVTGETYDQALNTTSTVTFNQVNTNYLSAASTATGVNLVGNSFQIVDASNTSTGFTGNHKRIISTVGTGASNDTSIPGIVVQGNAGAGYLSLKNFRWSGTDTVATQLNDTLGSLFFQGNTGGGVEATFGNTTQYSGATISSVAQENWTSTARGQNLRFSVTPYGTSSTVLMLLLNHLGATVGNNYNLVLQGTGGVKFADGSIQTSAATSATLFDQTLNTTDDVEFHNLNVTGILSLQGSISNAITIANTLTVNTMVVAGTSTNVTYDYLSNNGIVHTSYQNSAVSSNSPFVVSLFPAANFRSAKYFAQIQDGSNVHSTEINVIHNGTNVYKTEYGFQYNNGALGVFTADLDAGNIRLIFTPSSASNLSIRISATKLAV